MTYTVYFLFIRPPQTQKIQIYQSIDEALYPLFDSNNQTSEADPFVFEVL